MNEGTLLTIIGLILTIVFGIVGIIIAYKRDIFKKIYYGIKKYFSRLKLVVHGYYSHDFVKNKIKSANKIIRVICVRNLRILEPDIIEEIKKFILERDGTVEILGLSPEMPDEIISEIMVTLPKSPKTCQQFKDDICTNYNHLFNLYEDLGEKKSHLHYFKYKTLPLIHMCQFDDVIYLGFQLYYREKVEGSLLDYCIEIPANSKLGKKIIEQFEYLKKEKSEDVFKKRNI